MPLREDLLNPIPGDNPSGENLRYAPVYDKIKEARREDDEGPQGDWQRERKLADWPQVIKLCNESLATKSKDLQLAVWLAEALLKKEGLAQFHGSLKMIHGLLENFWDTLYPENEDGDLEFRATPLDWLGQRQDRAIREIPLVKSGHGYLKYKEARSIPTEEDAASNEQKGEARSTAQADGKLLPEEFDKAVAATSKEFYEKLVDEFDGTLETIETLGVLCEEKFGDVAPSYSPLKSALEEVRHVANMLLQQKGGRAEAEVEPEAPPEENVEDTSGYVSTGGGTAAAPAPAKKVRKATAGAEPVDVEDAAERIAVCAAFLRQQDPSNPAPYMLLRGFRFGELRATGPSPSYTLLEPPPTEIRQNLKRLASESDWTQVLETAENAMGLPCGRAWLDLQRYSHRAAEELGLTYVAQAIGSEMKALLADLPDLPTWTLSDDTPTANSETQTWLQQFKVDAAPAVDSYSAPSYSYQEESSTSSSDNESDGEPVKDSYQLAMEAMQSGRTQQAIEILTEDLHQQQSGRGRFQKKVQMAQIFLAVGQERIAESILEEALSFIDRHQLEDWETAEMIVHPLTLLFRCRNGEGHQDEKQKLYARICRLHPLQAFAVGAGR